jgi:hypothetical protein
VRGDIKDYNHEHAAEIILLGDTEEIDKATAEMKEYWKDTVWAISEFTEENDGFDAWLMDRKRQDGSRVLGANLVWGELRDHYCDKSFDKLLAKPLG